MARPLSFLWVFRGDLRPHRLYLGVICLLSIGVSGQSLATPQLTRCIIDDAYPARDVRLFLTISAVMVGLNVASAALQAIQGYLSTRVDNIVLARVRMRVFQAMNHVPVAFVERYPSGMLLERASADADATAGVLTGLAPQLASLAFTMVMAGWLMMRINILVTCLVLACVPLYCTLSLILTSRMRKLEQKMRRKADQITALAVETIQGVPTAKLFGAGKWLRSRHRQLLRDRIAIAFSMWRTRLVYGRLGWAVTYGWAVVLTCGGWYLVFHDRLLLGQAVALGMYIPLLLRPVEQAVKIYRSLMSASVSAQRIDQIIRASRRGDDRRHRSMTGRIKSLALRNVSFGYPRAPQCLKNISLDLTSGQCIAVIGPTGSGKTTLLRLLAGMYDRYEGQILVNGRSLSKTSRDAYQAAIAMVMSDSFFFSGSLMENLRIADRNSDPSAIRQAAQILGLDSWVSTLGQGYDTRVGVGGLRLSSGQAQQLAILRALLKRPKLLLLDEVTSAMDIESEEKALQGIRRLRPKGCLTVITTHRLAMTLQGWIDRVIVLENGRIAEQGSRGVLCQRRGRYHRLMTLAKDTAGHTSAQAVKGVMPLSETDLDGGQLVSSVT